jgi:thiopeptide-type bacteriocin biosynthesis protein
MPAHQLTRAEPIATAVLEVLAGTDPTAVAANCGIDALALADAVDAFTTAGLSVLHHPTTTEWCQIGVRFPAGRTGAEESAAAIAAAFDKLSSDGAHPGWWFLRKPPGWRVRARHADDEAVRRALDELKAHGVIAGWARGLYEPETVAFGGTAAMTTVHQLFCADTSGVLHHSRTTQHHVGPREISILLLGALTRSAGLDPFETGDVFAKVAALRPPVPSEEGHRLDRLAEQMQALSRVPMTSSSPLLATDGPLPSARPWVEAFETAGARLAGLATDGQLHRGLRSILAQIVIFHWNRMGLPTHAQSVLAAAAVQALLPGD